MTVMSDRLAMLEIREKSPAKPLEMMCRATSSPAGPESTASPAARPTTASKAPNVTR
jgi:hypothetical protein